MARSAYTSQGMTPGMTEDERRQRLANPINRVNPRKVNMPTLTLADPTTWQDQNPPPITPGGISVRSAYADPVNSVARTAMFEPDGPGGVPSPANTNARLAISRLQNPPPMLPTNTAGLMAGQMYDAASRGLVGIGRAISGNIAASGRGVSSAAQNAAGQVMYGVDYQPDQSYPSAPSAPPAPPAPGVNFNLTNEVHKAGSPLLNKAAINGLSAPEPEKGAFVGGNVWKPGDPTVREGGVPGGQFIGAASATYANGAPGRTFTPDQARRIGAPSLADSVLHPDTSSLLTAVRAGDPLAIAKFARLHQDDMQRQAMGGAGGGTQGLGGTFLGYRDPNGPEMPSSMVPISRPVDPETAKLRVRAQAGDRNAAAELEQRRREGVQRGAIAGDQAHKELIARMGVETTMAEVEKNRKNALAVTGVRGKAQVDAAGVRADAVRTPEQQAAIDELRALEKNAVARPSITAENQTPDTEENDQYLDAYERWDEYTKKRQAAQEKLKRGEKPRAGEAPVAGAATPNEQQVALLRKNPDMKAQFEQKFGPGTADKYLR